MKRLIGGRYALAEPVADGATGVLWRAYDGLLRRDVAVKEVRPRLLEDGRGLREARTRALREARSAARLNHRAIIAVHDLVEEDGRLWIVMERLEALSLSETVGHLGSLPVHWAAWIGLQLLGGLRHAHGEGVLHRDIRPGTILLTGDRVVLSEFGIAALNGESSLTMPVSPAFVAPERLRGQAATPSGDLWSFGACLYFAVEGRAPEPSEAGLSVLNSEPRVATRAGALLPVLRGLLHRSPAQRLTADHAARLLTRVLRDEGVSVSSRGLPRLPVAMRPPEDAFTL